MARPLCNWNPPNFFGRRAALYGGLLCLISALGGSPAVSAQVLPAAAKPPILANVSFSPKLNASIPWNLQFKDETGKTVTLSDYAAGGKPIILAPVYYTCPTLCDEVIEGLALGLRPLSFNAGQDFQVVAVSINPAETPSDALLKKQDATARYHHPGTDSGWHFLTGKQDAITALTNAANFHYNYDPGTKTFAHASGILILTPQGKISRYAYGFEFDSRQLKLALLDASQEKIGTVVDHLLLYCYEYNPATSKYGTAVARLLFWFSLATLLALVTLIIVLFRRGSDAARRSKELESAV